MKAALLVLTTLGSSISIGFGVWHFFVPKIWDWYSYIDQSATELVLAVRAINFFFSLVLVLLGIANLLLVWRTHQDQYSLSILLLVSVILWGARVVLQIMYPQGSQNPTLQYSMLSVFIVVLVSFCVSLLIVLMQKSITQ